MQIVTDSGTDALQALEGVPQIPIHVVPLAVTLDGVTYREGEDITGDEFYALLANGRGLPKTSQPAVGEFVELYQRLAQTDPDILSIHMSSGLSGTLISAQTVASMVPEAKVTLVDTRTLSVPAGWQVMAAARALAGGASLADALQAVERVRAATRTLFTLEELKYLIHGGRISHLKGLLASVLNIRPVIEVEKEGGTYVNVAQARTFRGALGKLVEMVGQNHAKGTSLVAQVSQAANPAASVVLHQLLGEAFKVRWLPDAHTSLVLSAHTGPSLIGLVFADEAEVQGLI